jgi:hypothetical protein
MFTLEQQIFIEQCYFRNGERFENDEWSYSTPRVFEELVLRKKGSGRSTKRTAENIEEVAKNCRGPK